MKSLIFIILPVAVCSFGAELKLGKNVQTEIPFEMTKLAVTCTDEKMIFEYTCEEPDVATLKVSKKNPAWDTFQGEAVELYFSSSDLTFSTYKHPDYRFRVNSYNTFLQTFIGSIQWHSRYVTSKVKFSEKAWTVVLTIPFASLETEQFTNQDLAKKKIILPKDLWMIVPSRCRNITGEYQFFTAATAIKPIFLRLPEGVISPYRSIAFKNIGVDKVDSDSGKTSISFLLVNPDDANLPFMGKAALMLSADDKQTKIAEIEVACEPGATSFYKIPFSLKESGYRYRANIEIYNAFGKLIKASRDLEIENPWVDFK